LFAYRTKKQSSSKIEPFYLVYGRNANLPTDEEKEEETLNHRIETLVETLPEQRRKAELNIKNSQLK